MRRLAALLPLVLGSSGGTGVQPSSSAVIVISVPGIPGPYCMYGIEKRLREHAGVDRVELL